MDRKEWQKNYQRQRYLKNKEYRKKKSDEYLAERLKWFREEIVAKLSCTKCGESHPGCLDFHHKDPSQKEDAVTRMVRFKRSREAILKEIEKCEVLCANCHRKHHYEERTNDV